MENDDAIRALAALAQEYRLAIFRRLVAAGEAGQTAGHRWVGNQIRKWRKMGRKMGSENN